MVRRPKVPRSLLENGHWGFPPKATHYPESVEARVGIASVLLESIVIAVSRNPEADRARELGWNNEERNLAIEYRWTEGRTERSIERLSASCGTLVLTRNLVR
jgi:hypothetical protein